MWLSNSWKVLLLLSYIFIADCVTQIIIYQDIQYWGLRDDGAVINQGGIIEPSTIRGRPISSRSSFSLACMYVKHRPSFTHCHLQQRRGRSCVWEVYIWAAIFIAFSRRTCTDQQQSRYQDSARIIDQSFYNTPKFWSVGLNIMLCNVNVKLVESYLFSLNLWNYCTPLKIFLYMSHFSTWYIIFSQ